jgi:anthranilate 1,2-dioxygenase small subunit
MIQENVHPDIERQIARLNTQYALCLDDDRIELWPGLFVDKCRYVIHPRENFAAGLEGYILYLDSNAMLRDRVTSLREANLFNIQQNRHLVSNIEVQGRERDTWIARASYVVIQTDAEGNAAVFSVGEYRDRITVTDHGARFVERIVITDNFNVHGMVAFPL